MKEEYLILQQLIETLQDVNGTVHGCIYGLETEKCTTLLSCVVEEVPLPHNPTFLLPAPLHPLAHFTTQLVDQTVMKEHSLLVSVTDREVHLLESQDGRWSDVTYTVVSQTQLESSVVLCRTHLSLDLLLTRGHSAPAVKEAVYRAVQQINSGGSAFLMQDSDLVLGETGVLSLGAGATHEEQTIGHLVRDRLATKIGYTPVDALNFDLLLNRSCNSSNSAPFIEILESENNVKHVIHGECLAYCSRSICLKDVGKILVESVLRKVNLATFWLSAPADSKTKHKLQSVCVLPYKSGHMFSLLYPESKSDLDLLDYRKNVNQTFLLPVSCPFMSRNNRYEFSSEKKKYHLYNTHIGLKAPAIGGLTSITRGIYSYHHYMQDNFNDNKWGCAYRSLQTIVSWFRHQGYTTKSVPTHKQIQQCLVSIGDKPSRFIDSREWIGSTEVGFVLDTYLGVKSRFITVASGDELSDNGREFVHHFKTQGTPIMIGGGVLAHTILGVVYDPDTGDINYLVLDPHYTGTEDIASIQKQGWCGWKGQKFWSSKAYYNLCLPQRPHTA